MSAARANYWWDSLGAIPAARPALLRDGTVDVAILGGGYTGLWTAYYLLRTHPELEVAIVEKEAVGYGASGRNGGWCSSRFPVTPRMLTARFGADAARRMLLAIAGSVDEVGSVCAAEGIDAQFRKSGILSLARGAHQLPAIQGAFEAYRILGLESMHAMLTPAQAERRVRATGIHGAMFSAQGASLHPARLVHGLADAVERLGGVIYEQTQVDDFRGGSQPRLITSGGQLRARKAIVLAGEAYMTRIPRLRRALLPVYSLIGITAPLSAVQWSAIGWENGECVASNKFSVDYLNKTADGRILFGSRGAPYQFGSRISDEQDTHAETHARIRRSVVEWFPALDGIEFTHAWGGPVGMPRDWMPSVRFDADAKVATAGGYTGQGVSTANLAGRALAGLITATRTGLEELPMVEHRGPLWEPEPARWLAVRYMQDAFLRIDAAAEQGRAEPIDASLAKYMGRH